METFTLKKANGHEISCMKLIPDGAEKIVIMVHGFGSRRDCETGKLLFRRMPPEGYGVVTYDQPSHGSDESRKEPLLIENCLSSLAEVENYIKSEYPDAEIFYFSSSFGAYITVLHTTGRPHSGYRAFLRSAAVNMPSILLSELSGDPDSPKVQFLKENGYFDMGALTEDVIRMPAAFFEELRENNLFERFAARMYDDTAFEMVHGEKDDTIELQYAEKFAKQFGIKISVIPGEGHTLSGFPETPDTVADLAIAFYAD